MESDSKGHMVHEGETKGEKRERKRKKRREMRVVGRSVRLLQQIILRRAQKARNSDPP